MLSWDNNAAINFCHNHPSPPPPPPQGICTENLLPFWGICILIFAQGGGGIFLGRALSRNDFCHFWNFHCNSKNWWEATLWGLIFVALKFYTFFLKKIRTSNIMSWLPYFVLGEGFCIQWLSQGRVSPFESCPEGLSREDGFRWN